MNATQNEITKVTKTKMEKNWTHCAYVHTYVCMYVCTVVYLFRLYALMHDYVLGKNP